jgi:hypothetical protein
MLILSPIPAEDRDKIVLWLREKGYKSGPLLTAVNNASDTAKMRLAMIRLHNLTEKQYKGAGVG